MFSLLVFDKLKWDLINLGVDIKSNQYFEIDFYCKRDFTESLEKILVMSSDGRLENVELESCIEIDENCSFIEVDENRDGAWNVIFFRSYTYS